MSLLAIHPTKALLQAWKRFRLRRGEKHTRLTEEKPQQARTCQPHHRHTAFLEFP
jgi:hypothetical protein